MKQVSEEQCWFVIGAHQAGASERHCSELSGLSKTLTHNIIHNFKKLGSPHASTLSMNTLLNQTANKRKHNDNNKDMPRKRGRPRKPAEEPFFTQSLVNHALKEARKQYKKPPFIYPLERPDTPPTDEEAENLKIRELPSTPRSSPLLDESDDEKMEDWSLNDDKELLSHVLGLPLKHIKWKQVEQNFQDRHLAKMCADRWEYLKKQLIKDIQNNVDNDLVL